MAEKVRKRKGELREDFYGTWHMVLKDGHDERWIGKLLPEEYERIINGEKYYCTISKCTIYKKGLKIWVEKDVDKELNNNQVWTLYIKDNIYKDM